jgi:uncharacterized protein (DUF2141 family)
MSQVSSAIGRRRVAAASAAAGLALLAAANARAAMVEVAVSGVERARGQIRVELCTRETFLKPDCPYNGAAPAQVGSTVVRISDVPPGEYAVQAFHDENGSGTLEQNFLGVPKEPVGFSNDAPVGLHGPRFKDAAFSVERDVERISLKLRRFLRAH